MVEEDLYGCEKENDKERRIAMTAFEVYYEKYNNIMKWLPEVLEKEFRTIDKYGHLLENHINKSDEFLMQRSARKKINASTFVGNEHEIVAHIHKELIAKAEMIAEYLADDAYGSDDYELECDLGLLQGKTYLYDANQHDWKDGPKSCSKFFIIIKKGRSTNHFFIKSVYPC